MSSEIRFLLEEELLLILQKVFNPNQELLILRQTKKWKSKRKTIRRKEMQKERAINKWSQKGKRSPLRATAQKIIRKSTKRMMTMVKKISMKTGILVRHSRTAS